MEADRRFFSEHPGVNSYDRPSFPDEHPYCQAPHIVTVTRIAPGLRLRQAHRVHFFSTATASVEA